MLLSAALSLSLPGWESLVVGNCSNRSKESSEHVVKYHLTHEHFLEVLGA